MFFLVRMDEDKRACASLVLTNDEVSRDQVRRRELGKSCPAFDRGSHGQPAGVE
jgi:hypothetical protein